MPELKGGIDVMTDSRALDNDRAALDRYEACLAAEAEMLAALDPEMAGNVTRQRDAAATLRRTLDAWAKARAAADARKGS